MLRHKQLFLLKMMMLKKLQGRKYGRSLNILKDQVTDSSTENLNFPENSIFYINQAYLAI